MRRLVALESMAAEYSWNTAVGETRDQEKPALQPNPTPKPRYCSGVKLVPLRGKAAPDSTLIYDWNAASASQPAPPRVTLLDETLRDGLQSPSVKNPSLAEKLSGLEL